MSFVFQILKCCLNLAYCCESELLQHQDHRRHPYPSTGRDDKKSLPPV